MDTEGYRETKQGKYGGKNGIDKTFVSPKVAPDE
jgi:hypothetical protein